MHIVQTAKHERARDMARSTNLSQLAACGGGGGSDESVPTPAPPRRERKEPRKKPALFARPGGLPIARNLGQKPTRKTFQGDS